MKRKYVVGMLVALLTVSVIPQASAHVSTQLMGFTNVAGQSSRVWLSLGHGCTYKEQKYGTQVFSVVVPKAAGKPTPQFIHGFKTTVVASTTVDSSNVPDFYTVTWTAKAKSWSIDDGTFFDFGMKVKWGTTPGVIAFPTTQTCFATQANGSKKPLYLKWIIIDGSTMASTDDTEFGPAPTVTTVAATK